MKEQLQALIYAYVSVIMVVKPGVELVFIGRLVPASDTQYRLDIGISVVSPLFTPGAVTKILPSEGSAHAVIHI